MSKHESYYSALQVWSALLNANAPHQVVQYGAPHQVVQYGAPHQRPYYAGTARRWRVAGRHLPPPPSPGSFGLWVDSDGRLVPASDALRARRERKARA